jgi:hypothetical protein
MIKVRATVIRRPHVSHEELVKVWETVHAPHVVKIAQPERYRITFFDQCAAEDDPGLDGMAELWFRDTQHSDTGIGRNAPPEIMDDGFSDYADIGKGTWLTVTEHVISLADLAGLAPDDFPHLVRPLLMSRGHEIRIVD